MFSVGLQFCFLLVIYDLELYHHVCFHPCNVLIISISSYIDPVVIWLYFNQFIISSVSIWSLYRTFMTIRSTNNSKKETMLLGRNRNRCRVFSNEIVETTSFCDFVTMRKMKETIWDITSGFMRNSESSREYELRQGIILIWSAIIDQCKYCSWII